MYIDPWRGGVAEAQTAFHCGVREVVFAGNGYGGSAVGKYTNPTEAIGTTVG